MQTVGEICDQAKDELPKGVCWRRQEDETAMSAEGTKGGKGDKRGKETKGKEAKRCRRVMWIYCQLYADVGDTGAKRHDSSLYVVGQCQAVGQQQSQISHQRMGL